MSTHQRQLKMLKELVDTIRRRIDAKIDYDWLIDHEEKEGHAPMYNYFKMYLDHIDYFCINILQNEDRILQLSRILRANERTSFQFAKTLIDDIRKFADPNTTTICREFIRIFFYPYATKNEREFLYKLDPFTVLETFFTEWLDSIDDILSIINNPQSFINNYFQEEEEEEEDEEEEYRRILQESLEQAYGKKNITYQKYQDALKQAFKEAFSGRQPTINKELPFRINITSRRALGILDFGKDVEKKDIHIKLQTGCRSGNCLICLESLQSTQSITMLGCRHCFHTECFYAYIQTVLTCPLCRTLIKEINISLPLTNRHSISGSIRKSSKRRKSY